MSILYLLIPLSLLLLSLAVWAFFWAVKNDQFDDLEGPAHRILFDDDDNDLSPAARLRREQAKTTPANKPQAQPGDAQPNEATTPPGADDNSRAELKEEGARQEEREGEETSNKDDGREAGPR